MEPTEFPDRSNFGEATGVMSFTATSTGSTRVQVSCEALLASGETHAVEQRIDVMAMPSLTRAGL